MKWLSHERNLFLIHVKCDEDISYQGGSPPQEVIQRPKLLSFYGPTIFQQLASELSLGMDFQPADGRETEGSCVESY